MQDEFVPYTSVEVAKDKAIKNILNIIDLAFEPEQRNSRVREKVRKVILDEVNEFYRMVVAKHGV